MEQKELSDRIEQAAVLPSKAEHHVISIILKIKRMLLPALIVIAVLLVALIIIANMRGSAREAKAKGYASLAAALDNGAEYAFGEERVQKLDERKAKLLAVLDDHSGSPAAAAADFHLARTEFMMGNFEVARQRFAAFVETHGDQRDFAAQAMIGEANALVELGDYQKAMDKFLAVGTYADTTQDAVLVNQAKYRAALCALALQKVDEAKKLLEDILAAPIAEEAKESAQELMSQIKILPAEAWVDIATEEEPQAPDADSGLQITPVPNQEPAAGGLQITPVPNNAPAAGGLQITPVPNQEPAAAE